MITELRRHHAVERIPFQLISRCSRCRVAERTEELLLCVALKKCSIVRALVGASTKDAIIRIAQIAGSGRGSDEIEPDHMAGVVAAPDGPPAAAVMVLFSPRRQAACGIACDGSLERQQRAPLARYAAWRRGRSCNRRRGRQAATAAAIYSLLFFRERGLAGC